MSEAPPLPEAVEDQLGKIGRAELLVGIPSYNNARTPTKPSGTYKRRRGVISYIVGAGS